MPRRYRAEWEGAIHHAVPQGNNRQPIVRDDSDRHALLRRLGQIAATYRWEVLAYALMATHLHYVVRTPQANLGTGTGRLLGGYARRFNERHDREGALFAPKFYSQPIGDEHHLVSACLYAVLNPVAAGVCRDPSDYPWSSYATTAGAAALPGTVAISNWLVAAFDRPLEDAQRSYRDLVAECAERVWRRRLEARAEIRAAVSATLE